MLGYRVLNKNRVIAADTQAATAVPEPAATVAPPANTIAEPAPAVSANEPAPSASVAVAPTPEPTPAASVSATPASEIRKVTVKSKPPKVRFFHFGKQVGVTPFVLEFKPGERHAYEAGLPGYGTRKVVIDGSKPLVVVGLTREKP